MPYGYRQPNSPHADGAAQRLKPLETAELHGCNHLPLGSGFNVAMRACVVFSVHGPLVGW